MYQLDKTQIDYLARTIMPELYKRQTAKDSYMEHLQETLPRKSTVMEAIPAPREIGSSSASEIKKSA